MSTLAVPATELVTDEAQFVLCDSCRTALYRPRLERGLKVCPDCGHHHRLTAAERIAQLIDDPVGLDVPAETADVLGFVDTVPYTERLEHSRRRTGLDDAVVAVEGTVDGYPVVAAVMDFGFLGGSLGAAVGEAITVAAEVALQRRVPLLLVTASGGARMQEGPISLMQMAKTSQALAQLDEQGVLTVALITDPTFGGVAASFATQCDVLVAEPGARLGFAGRRVIEQTIGDRLPANFQTAEFLRDRGFIDVIAPRSALRGVLRRLLAAGRTGQSRRPRRMYRADVVRNPDRLDPIDAWDAVQQARGLDRPTTTDYIGRICGDFQELHGDRLGGECSAIVGGVAQLAGRPVMVIGHQRGHTAAQLKAHNYGMPTPAGYRKAMRLMRLAAKLRIPVVTLVDTPGAFPGAAAEERGQAVAIAESIRLMTALPVPVVTVIIGEGGSGGALALAVADQVLMFERAVYSVITPEGCAAILWGDAAQAPTAARALRGDAASLLRLGVVDGVLREPPGGTDQDPVAAAETLRNTVAAALQMLDRITPAELVRRRRARFRRFGAPGRRVD